MTPTNEISIVELLRRQQREAQAIIRRSAFNARQRDLQDRYARRGYHPKIGFGWLKMLAGWKRFVWVDNEDQ